MLLRLKRCMRVRLPIVRKAGQVQIQTRHSVIRIVGGYAGAAQQLLAQAENGGTAIVWMEGVLVETCGVDTGRRNAARMEV